MDNIFDEIAEYFLHEFQEKYPKLCFTKLELYAPGRAIKCWIHGAQGYLFMLKIVRDGVLFDVENRPDIPGYNHNAAMGMLRRLMQCNYDNPKMIDIVYDYVDKFLRDADAIQKK